MFASMDIKSLVADFANRLSALIESQAVERARVAVLSAIGAPSGRGPGRPPKLAAEAAAEPKRARKKPPRQLCPVPGCKNTAAPIFGMVCAKHKDLPKAKIAKFREARRAKKLGLAAPKPTKRRAAKPARKKPAAARRAAPKVKPQAPAVVTTPSPAPSPAPSAVAQ
jgi:hypothetical protein